MFQGSLLWEKVLQIIQMFFFKERNGYFTSMDLNICTLRWVRNNHWNAFKGIVHLKLEICHYICSKSVFLLKNKISYLKNVEEPDNTGAKWFVFPFEWLLYFSKYHLLFHRSFGTTGHHFYFAGAAFDFLLHQTDMILH